MRRNLPPVNSQGMLTRFSYISERQQQYRCLTCLESYRSDYQRSQTPGITCQALKTGKTRASLKDLEQNDHTSCNHLKHNSARIKRGRLCFSCYETPSTIRLDINRLTNIFINAIPPLAGLEFLAAVPKPMRWLQPRLRIRLN